MNECTDSCEGDGDARANVIAASETEGVYVMRSSGTRALTAVGFSFLFALTAACGGSKTEAKAPAADATDATRVGSGAPDPSPPETTSGTPEAPKNTAVASADNGSDIIPPFSPSKDAPKKASPAKEKKKTSAKPKKKG